MATIRRQLIELLSQEPQSVSALALQLGLRRGDIENDLRHAVRSAIASGHRITVIPARCKDCGFLFGEDVLAKQERCPSCKGSRLFGALLHLSEPA